MIHLVLLSGGSGTRLWPLSNDFRSKRFLKILRDSQENPVSMVQRVLSQIRRASTDLDVTIASCESQRDSIERQIEGAYELVLEPGCQISYQRHQHRSEAWTIVSGAGEVVLDGCVQEVRATTELHIIEV